MLFPIGIAYQAMSRSTAIRSAMEHREKIFIYGTLADPEVQQRVWGRTTDGLSDMLKGYKRSQIEIEGEVYPLIISDPNSRVSGSVIEITEHELRKADEYETDAYRREKVTLESGVSAWVYVKK